MLLDIGIGIFSAIVIGQVFTMPLTPALVVLGITLALLPDLDFLYVLLRRGPRDVHAVIRHRDLLHYPVLYLPVGAAVALFFGPQWAILFLLASMGHFMHDSIGLGWGIPWFWPFANRNYTFFYRYTVPKKRFPPQVVYRWERSDIDRLIDEYRDPNWLRNIYLKLHPFFAAEIAGFLLAVYFLWRIGTALAGH